MGRKLDCKVYTDIHYCTTPFLSIRVDNHLDLRNAIAL